MVWSQVYDPLGNIWLSALMAAIPVVVMLGCIAFGHMKAHYAAGLGLASALLVAILGFGMPAGLAWSAAGYGAAYGLLPIGWIVLNIIFLHQLTIENGSFTVLQDSLTGITEDRRIQLLLIAFCFGAFFEGAAGFGTPVAVTAAIMIGLGFSPLAASGLCLIANTAPVAYGALGTPVIALAAVTGLDLMELSGMIGRILPLFSLIVPFWLIWAFAGWRGMLQIWPAILVAGLSFSIPQYLVSNFHGPWLVDVVAALISMISLILFLKVWKPKKIWTSTSLKGHETDSGVPDLESEKPHGHEADVAAALFQKHDGRALVLAWMPWVVLTVLVFIWGIPQFKVWADHLSILKLPVTGLHNLVQKVAPVVVSPHAEPAVYVLNWLSATGSGIFIAGILSGWLMKYRLVDLVKIYFRTIWLVRYSLLTIVLMLALGYLTRYSGTDATLGIVFAHTGMLYPIFGTLLGWMGVALTGSDTAANVLFGGLQKTTAEQLGLNPILMASANSAGGVMGKMVDAQSIVVASTATRWYGHEDSILRFVFFHSLALAVLVGLFVFLLAYVPPFTALVH
ncbi:MULTISPECIES: L-lactate permease [unclassified Undibacterium]|uniref:L-lactate permease n=1 Tax=unclassified Undibacterium TaxID=2630295 RepID=UPI002AC960F1|nr:MULTISPECIES: L-lactate permease [unclassified Undibacterium]MEB0138681.1 L-lactate permease [Undibacterium sp. CCC2.1]MEB0171482.1 L-lactate permease [Undibacterium sp. CCC1.1]MEB0178233.1 L-lactate permease [Undibacterium sp. CCC3.4]MEB0214359.1 L-lactate permease [Undibacterium sp. 5I2]WPX44229.1 L-lactate permease [Undibacterium sp. CCC3.4]